MTYKRRLPWFTAAILLALLLVSISAGWWRSSGTGPQVQVPMFYDAHYLFPRAWTQQQAAPGVPEPAPMAIYGPNRISQTFVSGSDRLSMIEVWLYGQANELVTLSLVDEQGKAVSGEISLEEGSEWEVYRLAFEPYEEAGESKFTLTLTAPNATIENPVVTRTVGGDRLAGALSINEYNSPGNMVLKTYASGLPGTWWLEAVGEQILPSIFLFRLRQYKPEVFKSTIFPVLTLITFGLSILFLILASPQIVAQLDRVNTIVGWSIVLVLALFLIWQIAAGRMIFKPFAKSYFLHESDQVISKAPAPDWSARLVYDLTARMWTAERYPEERFVRTDLLAGYPGIQVPADSRLEYSMNVPPNAQFHAGVVGEGRGELAEIIRVGDEIIQTDKLFSVSNPEIGDIKWIEIDLSPWEGTAITLIMEMEGVISETSGWWIMPQVKSSLDWVLDDPMPVEHDLEVTSFSFSDLVELIGYQVVPTSVKAGDTIEATLFWRPLTEIDTYGKVFVHLLDAKGDLVTQDDGQPVNDSYPIPFWQLGTIIKDVHTIELPPDLKEGTYQLALGLYDPESLERWMVQDKNGKVVMDGRVVLTTAVEVVP